jgi:chromosome segregation ATPase
VGAFTQSSAKETLQKTLQSIKLPSDPERTLYDEQRDLANIEETKREQERVLEAKKSGFLGIMQQMTAMQVEVDRMKSRKADKEKLELYEIKLIYEESKEGKRIIEMKQNDVNAAEEELTQAKLAVDPLEKKERELKKKQAVYIKNEENMDNVISKSELKVKRMKEKVEDLENTIEESHSELKLLDEIRKRDENELTKIEATIKATTEEIERRTKNIPQANLNLSEIKMKLIELNSNEATLSDDIGDTLNELNKYHNEIQTKTKKMGELKNAKQIFRQKMNNVMNSNKYDNKKIRDCLTLMDYFDREQDTLIANGTLRGEVYGPVGFYMKVSSPECVIMVEKSIPLKKLLSFVSSCDEDDRFVRSVIKRLNVDIDNFCMKNLEMPRPSHTENSFKSFKVIGYSVMLLLLLLFLFLTYNFPCLILDYLLSSLILLSNFLLTPYNDIIIVIILSHPTILSFFSF